MVEILKSLYHQRGLPSPVPIPLSTKELPISALHRAAQSLGIRQLLLLPLTVRDELIGTIGLGFTEEHTWSEEELRLMEQISRQISASLEVTYLFQRALRRAERERLVTEITTRLRASNDPQEILRTAARELQRALRVESAQVVILPENGGHTPGETSSGPPGPDEDEKD